MNKQQLNSNLKTKVKRKNNNKLLKANIVPVFAPVARGNFERRTEPRQRMGTNGSIIVSHREFVTDINSTAQPFLLNYQAFVNPGNQFLFPWLSGLAYRYESYNFKKLKFTYATSAPTSTPGYLAAVIDFNPDDPSPVDKLHMMQFADVIKGPVWQNFEMVCSPANLHKRKSYFVRSQTFAPADGVLPAGATKSNYDVGRFMIAAGGQPSISVIGDLWVDYEIELMTPELQASIKPPFTGAIEVGTSASGATAAQPFNFSALNQLATEAQTLIKTSPNGNGIQFLREFTGAINGAFAGTGITSVPTGASIKADPDTVWADEDGLAVNGYSVINAAGTLGNFYMETHMKPFEILSGFNTGFTGATINVSSLRFSAYDGAVLT